MSSLLSMMRKRGIKLTDHLTDDHFAALQIRSLDFETHRVNIQSVAEDVAKGAQELGANRDLRDGLEDVTPPHPFLWFEWLSPFECGMRVGVLCYRQDATDADGESIKVGPGLLAECGEIYPGPYHHRVDLYLFQENDGQPSIFATVSYLTDEFGQICAVNYSSATIDPAQADGDWGRRVCGALFSVLEAIARMNTRGTVISPPWPPPDTKPIRIKPNVQAPACVWRTIHIGGDCIPRQISTGQAACREAGERREQWVRAHRADYRKGKGLFGHIRKLIWIQEHKRGDASLGCVIPEYEVA